ncbi:MAG: NnrS family protein [Nitratireductor sp.]
MPIPRTRSYDGPALFSYGFRPFFLFGALYAALSILLWLPAYFGELTIATHFAPVDWHVHELLFGFLPAIITGFLFTAVPNWTGRMPLQGKMLILLVILWTGGRIAVALSAIIGWQIAMLADGAFLVSVTLVIAREITAGRNYRNLKVLIPLTLLALANLLFHLEAGSGQETSLSRRLAFAAIVMLIVIIGGRIVPSFTRNWLARENPGPFPAPFNLFDKLSIAATATALVAWVALPQQTATGSLLAVSGMLQTVRLMRWQGYRTWRDPLVWILHVSYGLLSVGLLVLGLSVLRPNAFFPAAALHLIAIGAIGGMTLSVMVRASRGHTGQALQAGNGGKLCFATILLAAAARVAAEYWPSYYVFWLHIAALGWITAYLAFAATFAPHLATKRKP